MEQHSSVSHLPRARRTRRHAGRVGLRPGFFARRRLLFPVALVALLRGATDALDEPLNRKRVLKKEETRAKGGVTGKANGGVSSLS